MIGFLITTSQYDEASSSFQPCKALRNSSRILWSIREFRLCVVDTSIRFFRVVLYIAGICRHPRNSSNISNNYKYNMTQNILRKTQLHIFTSCKFSNNSCFAQVTQAIFKAPFWWHRPETPHVHPWLPGKTCKHMASCLRFPKRIPSALASSKKSSGTPEPISSCTKRPWVACFEILSQKMIEWSNIRFGQRPQVENRISIQ